VGKNPGGGEKRGNQLLRRFRGEKSAKSKGGGGGGGVLVTARRFVHHPQVKKPVRPSFVGEEGLGRGALNVLGGGWNKVKPP